jgi:hypothetical protein
MATIYVAHSKGLAEWAAEVGLTKHVFLVGMAEGDAKDTEKVLNDGTVAAEVDWKVIGKAETELSLEDALARLGRKEKAIDPSLYPRLRGARGLFKVKLTNVENHMIVKLAMDGLDTSKVKVKPADIGTYLVKNATGA